MTNISQLQKDIHSTNVEKGFWDNHEKLDTIQDPQFRKAVEKAFQSQRLFLVASELTEALEYIRKHDFKPLGSDLKRVIEESDGEYFIENFELFVKDTYPDELADSTIRLMDIAGGEEVDLEWHILQKLRYNKTRARLHGKRF